MIWHTRYGAEFTGKLVSTDEAKGIATHEYVSKCGRCGGQGYGPWKVAGGVCFDCNGSGRGKFVCEKLYSSDKLAKLNTSQAKREATAQAKAQARAADAKLQRRADLVSNWEHFNQANPGLARDMVCYAESNEMLANIYTKLENYGRLSANQISFAKSLIAQAQEREAAKPCPAGRVLVTGRILKTETRESKFGSVLKMLFKSSDGFLVWCSVPSGLYVGHNEEVTFKATLEPSENDPKFGYGSRPTLLGCPARISTEEK